MSNPPDKLTLVERTERILDLIDDNLDTSLRKLSRASTVNDARDWARVTSDLVHARRGILSPTNVGDLG